MEVCGVHRWQCWELFVTRIMTWRLYFANALEHSSVTISWFSLMHSCLEDTVTPVSQPVCVIPEESMECPCGTCTKIMQVVVSEWKPWRHAISRSPKTDVNRLQGGDQGMHLHCFRPQKTFCRLVLRVLSRFVRKTPSGCSGVCQGLRDYATFTSKSSHVSGDWNHHFMFFAITSTTSTSLL